MLRPRCKMGLLGPHVPLCDAVVAGVTLLELENHNLTSRGPYIQKAAWASGLGSATLISAALTLSIALAALWYYNRRSVTRSSSPDPVGRVLTLGSDSPATYGSLFDTQLGAASGHASAALREMAVRRTYIIPRRDARARALTLKSLSFILLAFALLTQALTLHKSTQRAGEGPAALRSPLSSTAGVAGPHLYVLPLFCLARYSTARQQAAIRVVDLGAPMVPCWHS